MTEITPNINYTGPESLRKSLTKTGIKLLKEMKITQRGLSVRSQTKRFSDGTTITARTVENGVLRTDNLNINVPTGAFGEFKVEVLGRVFCPFYIGISDVNEFAWPVYSCFYRSRIYGDSSPGIHKNFEFGPNGEWNIDSPDGIKVYAKCSGNVDNIMQAMLDSEKSGTHFVTSLSLDYAETSYEIKEEEWISYCDTTTGLSQERSGFQSRFMDAHLYNLWRIGWFFSESIIDTPIGPYNGKICSSIGGVTDWENETMSLGLTATCYIEMSEAMWMTYPGLGWYLADAGVSLINESSPDAWAKMMAFIAEWTWAGYTLELINMAISDDSTDCIVLYRVYNIDTFVNSFYLYVSGHGIIHLADSEGDLYIDIGYHSRLKIYRKPHVFLFSYSTYTEFPDYSEEYKMTYGIISFEGGTGMITKEYICDDWYSHTIEGCVDQNGNPYIFFGEIDLMQTPTKYNSKKGEL